MNEVYEQGCVLEKENSKFLEGLRAAIDYRGDTTLQLKDGTQIEGFVFNLTDDVLQLFPADSLEVKKVALNDLKSISFSGQDTAKGKSWDDWQKKKDATKNEAS